MRNKFNVVKIFILTKHGNVRSYKGRSLGVSPRFQLKLRGFNYIKYPNLKCETINDPGLRNKKW